MVGSGEVAAAGLASPPSTRPLTPRAPMPAVTQRRWRARNRTMTLRCSDTEQSPCSSGDPWGFADPVPDAFDRGVSLAPAGCPVPEGPVRGRHIRDAGVVELVPDSSRRRSIPDQLVLQRS